MPDPQEQRTLYERYKLQWMLAHGLGLPDLIEELEAMIQAEARSGETQRTLQELFAAWEFGVGFAGGMVWPCFEEYLKNEGNPSEQTNQHLLISVFERNIFTESFQSLTAAREQMLHELEKEFSKHSQEDSWDQIKDLSDYECEDFGFSQYTAWSNLDNDCNCDWLIVGIP